MLGTGLILLGFLVKHVIDFRFNEEFHESPASTVHAPPSSSGPTSQIVRSA